MANSFEKCIFAARKIIEKCIFGLKKPIEKCNFLISTLRQHKRLIRRNIERFEGDDFMFEVSQEEILRCQNVTSSWGGSRYGAFAFTEIGVAMLSGVLNSKVASILVIWLKRKKARRCEPSFY